MPEFAAAHVTVGGEDITGVQLAALKPVTVTGRIIVPVGTQSFQPATMRMVTSPADPDQMMFGPGGTGKVNDDLTFELKVPPGRSLVRLLARTAGDWTTKAQRLNGVDVIDSGIDVRPGEDISGLEIELFLGLGQTVTLKGGVSSWSTQSTCSCWMTDFNICN